MKSHACQGQVYIQLNILAYKLAGSLFQSETNVMETQLI